MKNSRTDRRTRERLSREAIAASAVALADAEGLEAVTIRRLAQDHHVTPMALYWHYKDKDQLLDGVAERLFGDVDLPPVGSEPWPRQLRAALEAVLAALRPHPAVAGLATSRILSSEAGLIVAERTLSHLRQAGFSPETAAEIGGYLLSAVVTLVTSEPGRRHGDDDEAHEDAIRVKAASLGALSPRRYPNIVASAGSLAACASPDAYYSLGLDMLITGIRGIATEPAKGKPERAS
ncbi:TetR/AcrR family transcriptional regulator [Streptomyces sp. NBC_01217]|uniref:TetR/AcrR family transcriptional regulator n=1 Tax=Streptomyces sp. NBC_01217 TaxID=2903779 RepID=UPI002E0FDA1C|nr:TetR/AcrR family transcriptional regulator [Streptomyces sp. NBC_01217]